MSAKSIRTGIMLLSVLLCLLGLVLIIFPELSISVIRILCEGILICFGLVRIIGYFTRSKEWVAFKYDLFLGIIMMVFGFIMILMPQGIDHFVCIAFGLSFITDGLLRIRESFDYKKMKIKTWWELLILAILTISIGLGLMIYPQKSSLIFMRLIGLALLSEGILTIHSIHSLHQVEEIQSLQIMEAEIIEEREVE